MVLTPGGATHKRRRGARRSHRYVPRRIIVMRLRCALPVANGRLTVKPVPCQPFFEPRDCNILLALHPVYRTKPSESHASVGGYDNSKRQVILPGSHAGSTQPTARNGRTGRLPAAGAGFQARVHLLTAACAVEIGRASCRERVEILG